MNAILITIILLAVLAASIWLANKTIDCSNALPFLCGGLLAVFCALTLIIHIISLCSAAYSYGEFEAKRNAFEMTLNEARETGNQMEAASILRDVAQWNSELASRQYDNSTFVLGVYTDDRIETLKPIK